MNFNFQETSSYNPWDIDLQDKLDNLIYKRIDSICSILEQSGVVYALDLDVPEETVSFIDEIDFE